MFVHPQGSFPGQRPIGFIGATFLNRAVSLVDFLVDGGAGGIVSKEDEDPFSLVRTNRSPKTHQSIVKDASTEILKSLWLCLI